MLTAYSHGWEEFEKQRRENSGKKRKRESQQRDGRWPETTVLNKETDLEKDAQIRNDLSSRFPKTTASFEMKRIKETS